MVDIDKYYPKTIASTPLSSSASESETTSSLPPTTTIIPELIESSTTLTNVQQQQLSWQVIRDKILPKSIVSIDIGIRNLAWVELTKEGEILRWDVVDLQIPLKTNNSTQSDFTDSGLNATATAEKDSTTIDSEAGMPARPVRKSRKRKPEPPPVPPYDTHAIAVRLDQLLDEILSGHDDSQVSPPQVEGIVLERQRFRSGGMHTVLDTTIKCTVIEGMIHCWIAAWQRCNGQKQTVSVDALQRGQEEEQAVKKSVFIEAVPPKSVAHWWGISAYSASKTKASTPGQERRPIHAHTSDDGGQESANDESVLGKPLKAGETNRYHTKKSQSRAIVDGWLQNDDSVHIPARMTDSTDTNFTSPSSSSTSCRLRVRCSSVLKDWYKNEKKRDDLSDCLLQAVAWYEWRDRAIQEALDRSAAVLANTPIEKIKKTRIARRKKKLVAEM